MTIEDALESAEMRIACWHGGAEECSKHDNLCDCCPLFVDNKEFFEAVAVVISTLRAQQEAEKNEPLTLHQLNEMHGQPIWLDDSPNGWKCFIVNLCPVKDGKMVGSPCGVDFYGDLTSLSILLECGVYRRPPVKKET